MREAAATRGEGVSSHPLILIVAHCEKNLADAMPEQLIDALYTLQRERGMLPPRLWWLTRNALVARLAAAVQQMEYIGEP